MNQEYYSEKIEILLVDDIEENLIALEATLRSSGCHFIKARSGDQALRYLLEHEPALILMDVQMPGLDGFETASFIKNCERTREIPIIFVTATSQSVQSILKGYDYGAVDYIYKPFDAHILRSKVAVFVDLFRKTKKLLHFEKQLWEIEKKDRESRIAQLELKNLRRAHADQQRYLKLVDGINHGIVWSVNLHSLAVTFVSPSAERILGYSLEKWSLEQNFLALHTHPQDQDRFIEAISKAQALKKDVELEHRFITASGKVLWLHTGIRVVSCNEGPKSELCGLSIDISKIKEAEELLRKNKERSDFMSEASLTLLSSINYEEVLTYIEKITVPKLADLFLIDILDEVNHLESLGTNKGLIESKITGSPFSFQTQVLEVISTGKAQIYNKGAGLFSAIILPLITESRTLGAMTLVRTPSRLPYNTSDLPSAEDLARRAAAAIENAELYRKAKAEIYARDEFLSIASHELKTPLTPLKLQTEFLLQTLGPESTCDMPPEKISRILKTADQQIERLSRLTEGLLDLSRINSSKLRLNIVEFDIVAFCKEIVTRFQEQTLGCNSELKFEGQGPITVAWDRLRIEQVIVNLLTNAIKYGAEKPIDVSISTENGKVSIAVQDRGIGIAKKDQARIFGYFERAVSQSQYSGTGLGLFIVSQILRAHSGTIELESDLDVGSTFTIDVPMRVQAPA
jgi:PAS domain S-box-containing protein